MNARGDGDLDFGQLSLRSRLGTQASAKGRGYRCGARGKSAGATHVGRVAAAPRAKMPRERGWRGGRRGLLVWREQAPWSAHPSGRSGGQPVADSGRGPWSTAGEELMGSEGGVWKQMVPVEPSGEAAAQGLNQTV